MTRSRHGWDFLFYNVLKINKIQRTNGSCSPDADKELLRKSSHKYTFQYYFHHVFALILLCLLPSFRQTNVLSNCNRIRHDIDLENTESNPSKIYLLQFNARKTRKRCQICSNLVMKTSWRHSGVFIVNFEHISHLFLKFLVLNLNNYFVCSDALIITVPSQQ